MSSPNANREIIVFAHWKGMNTPSLMGTLHSELLRGKEIFSFEYDENWLHSEIIQLLDPDLDLFQGLHFLPEQKPNFGVFMDSSPDRWGRLLMQRREATLARMDDRKPQRLFETDYLLGVFDDHRIGGLRFKTDIAGPFLNDNKEMASPPWTSIRTLEEISLRLEDDDAIDNPDYLKWLSLLMAPGSSLGGARPKASVIDAKGHLWIAKFPSKNDRSDSGGWEMITYELALNAGLKVSECKAQKYSSKHHTFLTKRFDRTKNGDRLHFASAMTMLGFIDGQEGASYLDIVEFITTHGVNIDEDLEELWRRIVFNICVSNVDDHLRNHGFILTDNGWFLSPAFDINPDENGKGLNLNISEIDNSLELDLAWEVRKHFRLNDKKAKEILDQVVSSVCNWRSEAKRFKISKAEQELKSLAFSQAEQWRV